MLKATAIRWAPQRPLKVAIIGSGPSGFYSAARILAAAKDKALPDVQVHMYERLPVPNGLVRYGVAPDHLDVKNVEHRFSQIASDPRFQFFGNVNVTRDDTPAGTSSTSGNTSASASSASGVTPHTRSGYLYPRAAALPLHNLTKHYTQVLFAYGCSESRLLGIPGSEPGKLGNVHTALDIVNWYNGHPTAHDPEILAQEPWRRVNLSGIHDISIIGAGNVALDVARIVLRASTHDTAFTNLDLQAQARGPLLHTDVPQPVLNHLTKSHIHLVDICARRGPAQVAFTNKELREMMNLPGIAAYIPYDHILTDAEKEVSAEEKKFLDAAKGGTINPDVAAEQAGKFRIRKRLLSIFKKGSKASSLDADKTVAYKFFRAPLKFMSLKEAAPHLAPYQKLPRKKIGAIEWTETSLTRNPTSTNLSSTSSSGAPWGNEPPAGQATATPTSAAPTPADATNATLGQSSEPTSVPTGEIWTSTCGLAVSAVGYRGAPLDGHSNEVTSAQPTFSLPWDNAKGVVPNRSGRVVDATGQQVSMESQRVHRSFSSSL